jgi:hypothetical protein
MSISASSFDFPPLDEALFDNFAEIVEAAAEPYDPNITYLVGGKPTPAPELEPAVPPKQQVSCLDIINQIVSGKTSKSPAPPLNLNNSRLFKAREARLKAAAEKAAAEKAAAETVVVSPEVTI